MGNCCTKCRGKIQDYCRDSCGWCPWKCCKTVKRELKFEQTTDYKIEKKDIPYGYGFIHAGKAF